MVNSSRNKGIALSYINTVLNMVCGLFLSSYLLRMLGDTEYGIYQTISSFVNYLVLFEFGTGTVMTRNLSVCKGKNASKLETDKNVSTIWIITNILAFAILTVSVIFYFSIGSIYSNSLTPSQITHGKNMFVFMVIYLIASFYTQTVNGAILACEKYTFSSAMSIVRIAIRTALLTVLILFFKNAIIIAIIDSVLSVLITLYSYYYCKKDCKVAFSFKYFDSQIFKAMLPLCLAIFLQVIVNQANNNVDKFLIGIILTPEKVALYGVGMYIYSIFSSLTTIPISMYAPQIIKNVSNGLRGKELTNTLIQPSRLIVLIGGSVLFGFISAGKQFISIFYGKNYMQAWFVAVVIMVPMFINMANGILINVLDALGKRLYRSNILMFTTVANIFLTVLWIKKHGIVGAALATAICTFIGQVIVMNIYYKKKIGIPVIYMFAKSFKGILIYQIIGAVAGYFAGQLIQNVYLSFIAAISVFLFISLFGFLFLGTNNLEKQRIIEIKKKVFGGKNA